MMNHLCNENQTNVSLGDCRIFSAEVVGLGTTDTAGDTEFKKGNIAMFDTSPKRLLDVFVRVGQVVCPQVGVNLGDVVACVR